MSTNYYTNVIGSLGDLKLKAVIFSKQQ